MIPRFKLPLASLLGVVLGATAFACKPATAEAHRPYAGPAHSYPDPAHRFSVTLERPGGGSLPTYWYQGAVYVAGDRGARYNIRVSNHTAGRVEAVVTVDGRDAISGELGDYRRQRGYVIEPYGDVLIEGFRQSMAHVAAFRFSDVVDSYSARRGTPQHVGVIGVAVFTERKRARRRRPGPVTTAPPRRYYEPYDDDARYGAGAEARESGRSKAKPRGGSAPAADAADAEAPAAKSESRRRRGGYGAGEFAPPPMPQSELGTEYGETQYSSVREVRFKRRNRRKPDFMAIIHYDSVRGLRARGVPVDWPGRPPHYYGPDPQPFPGTRDFAPPPPPRRY
jgi:hypothetical protein